MSRIFAKSNESIVEEVNIETVMLHYLMWMEFITSEWELQEKIF